MKSLHNRENPGGFRKLKNNLLNKHPPIIEDFLPRFGVKTRMRINDQMTQIQHTTHSPQRASRQEKVALLSENPHLG